MQSHWKTELAKFVSNFSGHGFSNLKDSKRDASKLIWSFIITASFASCSFFMLTSLEQFLAFDIVTNIRVKKVAEIDFPALTFCEHTKDLYFDILDNLVFDFIFGDQSYNPQEVFEVTEILIFGTLKKCLKFNGRKLVSDKKVLVTTKYGADFGLRMILNFPVHIHYYIGENLIFICV